MTLRELFNKVDDSTVLYIGSNSGFFFIGTKEEYYNDIPKIEKYYYDLFLTRFNNARNRFVDTMKGFKSFMIVCPPIPDEKMIASLSLNFDEYLKRVNHEVKIQTNKVKNANETMLQAKHIFGSFHAPFLDREVVSVYKKKSAGEDGYAVVIKGDEAGRYWLRKEYKTKTVEKFQAEEDYYEEEVS